MGLRLLKFSFNPINRITTFLSLTKMSNKFLPSIRLMARAFHRVPPSITTSQSTASTTTTIRQLSATSRTQKWEGSRPEDHTTREKDSHNVEHDAVKEGKGKSRGASEGDGGSGQRAKKEFPEAPDTIGMQDERGGKSWSDLESGRREDNADMG